MKPCPITPLALVLSVLAAVAPAVAVAETFPTPPSIPQRPWGYVDSEPANLRVWYAKNSFEEERLALVILAMLQNEIVPREEALVGFRHPDDRVVVGWPNGGDGKLDVYLYDFSDPKDGEPIPDATAIGYPTDPVPGIECKGGPSLLTVNLAWARAQSQEVLASVLAHEYFHVLQNAFDMKEACANYVAVCEGSANYAMHHVYPGSNYEHERYLFSEDGSRSLLDESYETWPFYFYMVKKLGTASLTALFNGFATNGPYDALEGALEGGFRKHWVEYAALEWNQSPLSESFLQWDRYRAVPGRGPRGSDGHLPPIEAETVTLDVNGQYRHAMDIELAPLTRTFFAFDFSDPAIRSVAIHNPVQGKADKLSVKLLGRRRGSSRLEEIRWEDNERRDYLYCLDKRDEGFDFLVLVAANHRHGRGDGTVSARPELRATNQGCFGFKGTVRFRQEYKSPDSDFVISGEVNDYEVRETGAPDDSLRKNKFLVEGGSGIFSALGKMGRCEANYAASLPIKRGPKAVGVQLESYAVAPAPWGKYQVHVPLENPMFTIPFRCGDQLLSHMFPIAISSAIQMPVFPEHGGRNELRGEARNNTGLWVSWDLAPIRE